MKPTGFLCALALLTTSAQGEELISWKRVQLSDQFYSEGANFADIDKDGHTDILSGPYWYAGPDWQQKHEIYPPKVFNIVGYSDNFFSYPHDFNADGLIDILVLGFPGKEARLYLNPGAQAKGHWPMHIVADVVDNESPVFTDITGDGKPEIVCSTAGRFGWFSPNWDKPTERWTFTAVTPDQKVAKFTHGLGVGDVNGDGKLDLLEARHWWEQPKVGQAAGLPKPSATKRVAPPFTQHTFATGIPGGAQMFAYDFNGDGTNDIATALAAHRYGVAVFFQTKNPEPGTANWTRKMLVTEQPYDNDYGIVFSQPHAMYLADIDGDGIKDLVTGKRYWAHNGKGDLDETGARVVYWFKTQRDGKGGVEFIPHLIDSESGVGTDVQVGDVNGDKLPDIVIGNKSGTYVLLQERVKVTAETAAIHAPKKLYGEGLRSQEKYLEATTPEQALANMQLPAGFKAELIAHEPDLVQPIAMTFDERGRIWVVEGKTYPKRAPEGEGRDRILILEDSNGDGTYETRKVFCEGLNLVSGIEVGFGGVWVGAAPYLIFIPRDGDKPLPLNSNRAIPGPSGAEGARNGPATTQVPGLNFTAYVLLDGWGYQDTHETLNSFLWGPDGWLYGVQGVFTHSKVGKPGTPEEDRTPLNACVWRYHPVRHEFEIFAHGTSNPWGLDYNEHGEFFTTACVIPHLYHIVPGGRYQRQAGQHFNPYTYEDIKTIADHAHFAGDIKDNAHWGARAQGGLNNADTDAKGGGHAHCGLAIYNGTQFPPEWRGKFIFANLHGHRLVTDYIEPKASTFVGHHGSDFLRANDHWFMSVTQKVGPDGALYITDWQDKTTCHRTMPELWDQSNGRLYRISYVGVKALADQSVSSPATENEAAKAWTPTAPFDLGKESDANLAQLALQSENEWFSRMSRRVLAERWAASGDAVTRLFSKLAAPVSEADWLRAAWLTKTVQTAAANSLLDQDDFSQPPSPDSPLSSAVRAQWIRHDDYSRREYTELQTLASKDPSAIVRRELASALQRLPQDQRQPIATALLQRAEDKDDPVIPLLIWYGIEPLVGADAQAGLTLAKVSKMPKVTDFIYRRLAEKPEGWDALFGETDRASAPALKEALVTVLVAARKRGVPQAERGENWPGSKVLLKADASAKLKQLVLELSILEREPEAVAAARSLLADAKAPRSQRELALDLLLKNNDSKTAPILHQLLQTKATPLLLRRAAIQALASLPHPDNSKVLISVFASLAPAQQSEVVNALATSAENARALVTAVGQKTVPRQLLSPFLLRQMQALKNPELDQLMKDTLGDLNAPKANLAKQTAKYRTILTPEALAGADATAGKLVYAATCGACHKLFGEGQNVGPDITGSNRTDLNYLLENVLDPNGVIGKEYQLNLFTLKDGRVMGGIVKEESEAAVKIAMMGGAEFLLTKADITKREVSKQSTMPEGLFDALPQDMLLNLVKYLQSSGGVGSAPDSVRPGLIEGESLTVTTTGGSTKPQAMGNFRDGTWSGASQLWWTGAKPGDKLTATFKASKAGRQKVFAVFTKARDYGIITVRLNGAETEIQEYDLYDPKVTDTGEELLGEFDLKTGPNTLEIEITGAHPDADPRHMAALDYLRIE
jgi:putative membrane-bound dehydrogenase-like protein